MSKLKDIGKKSIFLIKIILGTITIIIGLMQLLSLFNICWNVFDFPVMLFLLGALFILSGITEFNRNRKYSLLYFFVGLFSIFVGFFVWR